MIVIKEVTMTAPVIYGIFVPGIFGHSFHALPPCSSPYYEVLLAAACSLPGDGGSQHGANRKNQWHPRPSSASFPSVHIPLSKAKSGGQG